MGQSDSRSVRWRFLSLRRPSCLALVVSAAGTLRASSVPCVCFRARHALRPRQAFHALTSLGRFHFGFRYADTVPACVCCFRGCIACAGGESCLRLTLFPGYASRRSFVPVVQRSTGSPSAEQPSVLGSWLDFSIHHFRSELRKP